MGPATTPRLSPREAEELALRLFAVDGSADLLTSERDQNFRLVAGDGRAFVLKLANAAEDGRVLSGQNALLRHLAVGIPDLPVPRIVETVDGSTMALASSGGQTFPHEAVGAVKGAGLFLGVAIVDPATGQADPVSARRIINEMCRRGVLVGLTGPSSNLLKIRPPLVFGRAEADLLVGTLEAVLESAQTRRRA